MRGFQEEGSTTTPFDMAVRNRLDRFHLVADVADRVAGLEKDAVYIKQAMRDRLVEHERYIGQYGRDMPEIVDWRWPSSA